MHPKSFPFEDFVNLSEPLSLKLAGYNVREMRSPMALWDKGFEWLQLDQHYVINADSVRHEHAIL